MIRNIAFNLGLTIVGALMLIGCEGPAPVETEETSFIYVVMHENDVPHLDFDGDPVVKETRVSHDRAGSKEFDFSLIAMQLPHGEGFMVGGKNDRPENHVIEFSGKIVRSGEDHLKLEGSLINKTPVVVQFVEMLREDSTDQGAYPEIAFSAGTHSVEFEGTISAWYQASAN